VPSPPPTAASQLPSSAAPRGRRGEPPALGTTYQALEKARLLQASTGSLDRLRKEVEAAEARSARGEFLPAAVALYAVVESPRFADFNDLPEFQAAEYLLARALVEEGISSEARRYLQRLLERGPQGSYFVAAVRRTVDLALKTRDLRAGLILLEPVASKGGLPPEAQSELAYLRARQDLEMAASLPRLAAAPAVGSPGAPITSVSDGPREVRLNAALTSLAMVDRKSRFYAAALYQRGRIAAQRREFKTAADAFCSIVDTPDKDRVTFFIDGRYYPIRDLARLGLGRVAHEERRYGDAYYHYFQVPQDSDRLAEALFEAAHSMVESKEYGAAASLLDELVKTYPGTPLALESELLRAHLHLRQCRFAEAESGFERFIKTFDPLAERARAVARDPELRQRLVVKALELEQVRHQRELSRSALTPSRAESSIDARAPAAEVPAPDTEILLAGLLRLDAQFAELHDALLRLEDEASGLEHLARGWRGLLEKSGAVPVRGVVTTDGDTAPTDAAALAEAATVLRREAEKISARLVRQGHGAVGPQAAAERARLAPLLARARQLELKARTAAAAAPAVAVIAPASTSDPGLRMLLADGQSHAAGLRARVAVLRDKLRRAAAGVARHDVTSLSERLDALVRKARLGKIDAVLARKRRVELEIQNLALGRFPPELFGSLYDQGLIDDDEEFWPFEGEQWNDEYRKSPRSKK
jgi:TolA-binding protein